MTEQLISLVVCILISGLSGCQIADTWIGGSIFRIPREWFWSLRVDSETEPSFSPIGKTVPRSGISRRIGELFTCAFCLTHWTCAATFAVVYLNEWGSPWHYPVYWLSAVKVATLMHNGDAELPVDVVDQTIDVDSFQVED